MTGEEDFSEYTEQIREMPALLADAAGTEEPETVGELISTWNKAVEKLKSTREELVSLRLDITSQL